MAYIRFAKEEKHLFRFLFMRERSKEQIVEEKKYLETDVHKLSERMNLSFDTAFRFHTELWFLSHGIATMLVTSYFDFDMETISKMLSDAYKGLLLRYQQLESNEDYKGE